MNHLKSWRSTTRKQLNESVDESSDAILAFRTITTMLALIQSPIKVTDSRELEKVISKDQRRELRLLDALAAVAVRQHEIVAAMDKGYNGFKIELLISVNNVEPALNIPQHNRELENPAGWKPSGAFNWLISPNTRDLNREQNQKITIDSLIRTRTGQDSCMAFVDPNTKISEELSRSTPDKLLDTFLLTEWGNESFTFDTHIWMLKTLLGQSRDESDDSETLLLYIIAASFPKMLHQMNSRLSYFDCLKSMELNTLGFTEPPRMATKEPNDRHPDQMFLDYLPVLKDNTALSKLLSTRDKGMKMGTHYDIYNKETYIEFHELLCRVLLNYRILLTDLQELQQKVIKDGLRDVKEIRRQLQSIKSMGRILRAMVTGNAIEMHLQNIECLLEVDDGMLWRMAADSEGDYEFDALKPYSTYHGIPLLPRQSYKDWLRSMVVYFDAESLLRIYFKHQYPRETDIDIKILASSLPTQNMLPWKELLRHKTYFPDPSYYPGQQPSVEELITFLTTDYSAMEDTRNEAEDEDVTEDEPGHLMDVGIYKIIKSVKVLKAKQESAIGARGVDMDNLIDEFDLVRQHVSLLKDCSSHGSIECTTAIFENIQALTSPGQTPLSRLFLIRDIVELLEILKARSALYWALKEDQPLSKGNRFSGTRHCEACMASFKSLSSQREPSQYDPILSEFAGSGQIIGVSKRSCPVCVRLLDRLKIHDGKHGKRFFTTVKHSTITPCTLPEWLPADIIKAMTVEFGMKLRDDLNKLRQRTEVLRRRSSSTNTRRISEDSDSDSDIYMPPMDIAILERAFRSLQVEGSP